MATAQPRAQRRIGRNNLPDPLYFVWRKLTSVRVAVILILIATLFALVGVIIPQVPPQLADSPARVAAHVEAQRGTWGAFTDILAEFPWFYDANGGIFNLFNQPYWWLLVALLSLSITTCTVSRFPPIWRSVRRPQHRVNDAYFERARNRFDFGLPVATATATATASDAATPAVAQVEALFRKGRYKIRSETRDGATYIFADRFQWSQLATFASHLALITLVVGTLITKFGGEELQFWVGEGQSRALFATGGDRQQVQIIVDDAIARFNDDGQALDFRTILRVTSGGEVVAAGEVTVNGPLTAAGFRIHQAAYWEHGAALQVRDAGSGQLLYSEVLFLDTEFFGPRIRIENATTGQRFTEEVVQLPNAVIGLDDARYQLIPLSDDSSIALTLVPNESGAGVDFFYSVVPFQAGTELGAALDADALRLHAEQPRAPRIRLSDASSGDLLVDDVVPLPNGDLAGRAGARFGVLPLADGQTLAVGFDQTDDGPRFFYFNFDVESQRGVLDPGQKVTLGGFELEYVGEGVDRTQSGTLDPGQSQRIGAVQLTYEGPERVFWTVENALPGADSDAAVILERFGQERTAEEFNAQGGENVALADYGATSSGGVLDRPARLGLGLGGGQPRFDLDEGESRVVGAYEYTFLGPREFTGLNLRRDPGGNIFWVSIIVGLVALTLTFFVPRRRVWAKVTTERTYLAGIAGHGVNLRREFERFARDLGSPDAPPEQAWDDDWDSE